MSGFNCTESTLPTVAAVLLDTAVALLRELYAERGPGPWVDDLHKHLATSLKNQEFVGIPPEAEREQIKAGLKALAALFSAVR